MLSALAVVTACTLAFQVAFTRMMSSVLAYHFSFLAISLALLGAGAGSLLVYLRPSWLDRAPLDVTLARWSLAYAYLTMLAPLALVRLDYAGDDGVTLSFALNIGLACLLAALPSLAAGALVTMAIRGYPEDLGRVYAWDLVGAGVGALVIVPLLHFPAPSLLVGIGVAAACASAAFAWPAGPPSARGVGAAVVGIVLIVAGTATSILYVPMTGNRDLPSADRWHPLSRVQGLENRGSRSSVLLYDRVYAPVPHAVGGRMPDWKSLRLGPASIGYEVAGPGHALVIGGGGGRDIYNALAADQTVDVIELNSAIRDVVDDDLGHLSGAPYTREGVSTSIGDGRAILANRDTTYDQIHIGFTDTLSANAAQGFALSENNLYTLEAFEEYLDHLTPTGILNVSRLEQLVGDEAIRVTVLTMAALEAHGIEDPSRHMVVIRGVDPVGLHNFPYETVLARLTPFTDAELATIRELAEERAEGIAYMAGGPYRGAWKDLAEAPSWRSFCSDYPLNVCPPTDDKPFFFNMRRVGDIFATNTSRYTYDVDPYQLLLLTLVVLVVLSTAGLLLPLWLARRLGRPSARARPSRRRRPEVEVERPGLTSLLYFGAVGLGFMLLETVLIQRFVLFLGFPTYALSVVLFALLVFTGIGSALSDRVPRTQRALVTVLGAVVTLVVLAALVLQPLLESLMALPFGARVAISVAVLAPVGLGLGMPMPLGLARFAELHPRSVAYAWGVNGMASVLASVLGVAIAINFGYRTACLVAAAFYGLALAHAAAGRWAERSPRRDLDEWAAGDPGAGRPSPRPRPPARRRSRAGDVRWWVEDELVRSGYRRAPAPAAAPPPPPPPVPRPPRRSGPPGPARRLAPAAPGGGRAPARNAWDAVDRAVPVPAPDEAFDGPPPPPARGMYPDRYRTSRYA